MAKTQQILIVEDDPVSRLHLELSLSDDFDVACVDSGSQCLEACRNQMPDLILLDVEMDGLNGYDTCRHLRDEHLQMPGVIFVTSRDRLEDKLEGYDAGGDDYVLKPVEPAELLRKISRLLKKADEKQALARQVTHASQAAITAMSNLGETGILLRSFQSFNSCETLENLAETMINTLNDFSLKGMVRLEAGQETQVMSTSGTVSPIEIAILKQVASMGRIVEFRSRLSVSYEHATLVITNLPNDNDELRGRLRDHLAILLECADSRALSINRGAIIQRALKQTNQALLFIQDSERDMQTGITLGLQKMANNLEQAIFSAALTEEHERKLTGILDSSLESIRQIMLTGESVLPLLTAAIDELRTELDQ